MRVQPGSGPGGSGTLVTKGDATVAAGDGRAASVDAPARLGRAGRTRVAAFLAIVALVIAVAPVVNWVQATAQRMPQRRWYAAEVLFNLDFLLGAVNGVLWRAGISTDPAQVIVGRDDWLFLGDHYAQTITAKRRGVTPEQRAQAGEVARAMAQRQDELARRGVPLMRILVAPDKDTAYSDLVPRWARAADRVALDEVVAQAPPRLVVDARAALAAARQVGREPLYFRTDTHWTHLGAWIAFEALGRELTAADASLRWLREQDLRVGAPLERPGGDLARFLRLERLRDHEAELQHLSATPVQIEVHDLASGERLPYSGNPDLGASPRPALVRAKGALNARRVLWLRDSFGTAMAPFMAATFDEVVQVHFDSLPAAEFWRLVETFQPSVVIVTVVQRNALSPWLQGRL